MLSKRKIDKVLNSKIFDSETINEASESEKQIAIEIGMIQGFSLPCANDFKGITKKFLNEIDFNPSMINIIKEHGIEYFKETMLCNHGDRIEVSYNQKYKKFAVTSGRHRLVLAKLFLRPNQKINCTVLNYSDLPKIKKILL